MATAEKSPDALKTIGELSLELGVAQHILRYWETKFPRLKPMQRAGNRRYYRPADVELALRIHRLLNVEGYTVRGVQKVLRTRGASTPAPSSPALRSKRQLPACGERGRCWAAHSFARPASRRARKPELRSARSREDQALIIPAYLPPRSNAHRVRSRQRPGR